jgi:hypothetical protein
LQLLFEIPLVGRATKSLLVSVQLVGAESGKQLWAEQFDKAVADLFDIQDEIVSRLARTLGYQLIVAEAGRAERSLHSDPTDLFFQANVCLYPSRKCGNPTTSA